MKKIEALFLLMLFSTGITSGQSSNVMTVMGPIPSSEMNMTLIHEHVLVDFIGAEEIEKHRWDVEEVVPVVLPYLSELKDAGVQTLIECTPAYLGRDPLLLKILSEKSGIQLITNTGYYGASDNKFLPAHAFTESADELALRWTKEWEEGIDGTGIKPGFIKIGVNSGELTPLHQKLIRAAARTHLKTGLPIASHTGPAIPAFQQIEILQQENVSPEAFIWTHAQSEKDPEMHLKAAQKGIWISLDGINEGNMKEYLEMINNLRNKNCLSKILISQDAGWYSPGEENGGDFRGYNTISLKFIPLLRQNGYSEEEIRQLLLLNPRKAFEIEVRMLE